MGSILKMLRISLLVPLFSLVTCNRFPRLSIPDGPQGPSGAIFKYDLLSNSQAGINYPGQHIGAFVAQDWPPGVVNQEDQAYVPEAASQDGNGEITIKAEKHGDGSITSARLESYQVHSKILTQSRSYIIGCKFNA